MTTVSQLGGWADSTGSSLLFRNKIINGNMRIDQRNSGALVTRAANSNSFTVDRWLANNGTDGTITLQQSSDTPSGFDKSLVVTVTATDTSIAATQFILLRQSIEGFNTADLAWGTSAAKAVTLSFWAKSSVTGVYSGALRNSADDRSYIYTYSILVANTWEYKTITIAGDTAGTWLKDNGIGVRAEFSLATGSTYATSPSSWTAGTFLGATGTTNLAATNGATFYVTGVQLEAGSQATPFEQRPVGLELSLCQRYYRNCPIMLPARTDNTGTIYAAALPITYGEMRIAPVVSGSGGWWWDTNASNEVSLGTPTWPIQSTLGSQFAYQIAYTSALSSGGYRVAYVQAGATLLGLSAEL